MGEQRRIRAPVRVWRWALESRSAERRLLWVRELVLACLSVERQLPWVPDPGLACLLVELRLLLAPALVLACMSTVHGLWWVPASTWMSGSESRLVP